MLFSPNTKTTLSLSLVLTICVLSIPFIAMQLSSEVDWSLADFALMGTLIMASLFAILTVIRTAPIPWLTITGIALLLLMTWTNLAVGFIGAPSHPLNLIITGASILGFVGLAWSRLQASKLAVVFYAVTALLLIFNCVAAIGLFSFGMHWPISHMIGLQLLLFGFYFSAQFNQRHSK